jgi:hypothetical protein
MMKKSLSEAEAQERLAELLNRAGLLWCAVPNGGYRRGTEAVRLRRQGVKRGVPDLLIFDPPPSGHGVGFALELKRGGVGQRRGTVSTYQREWLEGLRARGWRAEVAYGLDHAVELLSAAGYLLGGRGV